MDFTRSLQQTIPVIDRWLDYNVATDPRLPGLSVGIVYKDQVLFSKGYGYANRAEHIPAREDTCYRIASISKIFTTIALLQLIEQGKTSLDARVQEHLPWFTSSHDANLHTITLRQLLTHLSGLDRDGETLQWIDFQFPALAEIQQHIQAGGATVFRPQERWKYSNYAFTILGEVIKQLAGLSYEDYVTRNIVERLGLELTAPTLTAPIRQHLGVGYSRNIEQREREPFPAIETNAMASATGFSSTVVDLCRFISAQFPGNTTLLSDQVKQEMRTIQSPKSEVSPAWGLGLESWEVDERRLYGHSGGFPGYISRFGFDPERSVGVVVLANAIDAPSSALVNGIWECFHYFVKQEEALPAAEPAGEKLTDCAGTFRNIWEDVEVVALGDRLVFYSPDQESPAKSLYRLRYESECQYRIVSGNGFGHVGELARFVRQGDAVNRLFIGPNPFERVPLREKQA
jgi:CubicO group peptidase (beta-lactamase class C family)